jgi:hypothetical protein
MLDLANRSVKIRIVDREDKALQRCNLSAWSTPGDRQGHIHSHMFLSSCLSLGHKAQNLRYCDEDAITILKHRKCPSGQTYVYIFNSTRRLLSILIELLMYV